MDRLMRLHVVGLPHTHFTPEYSWCAYTTKVSKFARMMTDVGCDVITYGNGEADLPGKYVKVDDTQYAEYFVPDFNAADWVFAHFNNAAIGAIYQHIERDDIICVIGGNAQQPIATYLPHWPTVEFGIGYSGVFAKYRVWESRVWESHVHGVLRTQGSEFDTVIANYFDPDDFALSRDRTYFAYVGRVTHCKGVDMAIAACREAGVPLKIAGHIFDDFAFVRELKGDIEYVGDLDPVGRKNLLRHAIATFTPSRYIEPFCGVHIESLLSGAPVITTDWGIFIETVTNGIEGQRCRTREDFVNAITWALTSPIKRTALRSHAIARYSMEAIAPQYVDYFERVQAWR